VKKVLLVAGFVVAVLFGGASHASAASACYDVSVQHNIAGVPTVAEAGCLP
jgi:hypothetical protein